LAQEEKGDKDSRCEVLQVEHCDFPDDLYYDVQNDVWLKPVSNDIFLMGVTKVLSSLSGKFTKVNLKRNIVDVHAGQSIGTIESGRYFGAIRAPVEGRVIQLNSRIEEVPQTLNDFPYTEGWVARIRVTDVEDSLSSGINKHGFPRGTEATGSLETRIKDLKVRCFKKTPDEEMSAIGSECFVTLVNLGELFKTRPVGTVVHIVSDDPLSGLEMIRWADQTKHELVESREEGNLRHFIVEKKHD
jgi:glycine cleavage system H protein